MPLANMSTHSRELLFSLWFGIQTSEPTADHSNQLDPTEGYQRDEANAVQSREAIPNVGQRIAMTDPS